ncbi:DNA replication complex GINS protein SLD5 [Phytophthora pseudosyringae]|uniref:DNA replication complex GINS protein SLD5 n=1 Tax=Phytophthora pseudosyringae TaxID=221518 RepID=A0A8T1VGR6_9STRA|nr:DNA replication complex GINS protein SLD5 [Phytophthora pseudosyringae]
METPSQPEFDQENLNEDVLRMRTLWVNEVNAPEILRYDEEMVAEMLEQIRNQQEFVDSVYEDRAQLTEEKSFVNKLYQMEIDRLRYMVSSYLRTRLRKIEKFAIHILSDAVQTQRLSVKERNFAQQFVMLFESHVGDLALGKFAEEHRTLTAEGMVAEPNLDSFVFCQGKEAGGVQCDDKGGEFLQVTSADRYVLRYKSVQEHVETGSIGLI